MHWKIKARYFSVNNMHERTSILLTHIEQNVPFWDP